MNDRESIIISNLTRSIIQLTEQIQQNNSLLEQIKNIVASEVILNADFNVKGVH